MELAHLQCAYRITNPILIAAGLQIPLNKGFVLFGQILSLLFGSDMCCSGGFAIRPHGVSAFAMRLSDCKSDTHCSGILGQAKRHPAGAERQIPLNKAKRHPAGAERQIPMHSDSFRSIPIHSDLFRSTPMSERHQ